MTEKTKSNLVEVATYSILAALLGGFLTFLALRDDDSDPDRPPIIVRNGSVIIEERSSSVPGELKHASGKTWYHAHAHRGPKRLNAFVVGIANNSCGSGVSNFVSNVKKTIVTYSLGENTWTLELSIRNKQIEIDVVSGPDPTNTSKTMLSFADRDARLKEVLFEYPSGTERCELDPGGTITLTQHW